MLSLARFQLRSDPYPIGLATDVFNPLIYDTLVDAFPTTLSLFREFSTPNRKWSLSEVNHPENYHAFIESNFEWIAFYRYIKSDDFIGAVTERLGKLVPACRLRSRFEFSVLPADGGCLLPHTDIPSKVVTLVVPMLHRSEWKPEWGGGTDVLVPKDREEKLEDYRAPLDRFNKACTFDYAPNQALVFIKSERSWHSVGPIQGPAGALRKTLTINLERTK